MALRISRRSTDCGRPPGLGLGIRGWTSFHWASVRSVGYFARLIPFSTPKTRGEVHFSHRLSDNLALTSSAPTPLRDQTGSKTLICSYLAFQHSTLSITSSSPHLEGHLKQALPGRQNRVRTTMPSPSSSPLLSKVLATFTSTLKSRASLHLRGPARRCRSAVRQVPQFSCR